ncbi:hypothetical protein EGI88_13120 [Empedobacter falsenii]|uniref:Uncharacterized protein n=1 Tax=Empedobacter falsenii TaxID=343874 RepID=A0A3R8TJS0_9FLAO|nr:hypothetical protein EGI88_13120 [Empedobacter falsenii]RRT88622.1 hypothetical protein EGI89_13130 [Empedobacter falsenii]HAR74537.1 hypothetical protein [Flavobacteriaceae bacterium]
MFLKIGLIILLTLIFLGINIYLKTFDNPIILFIILIFSSSIIFLNLFLKLSPINDNIDNFKMIKTVRLFIFKIIFPTLITIFQIILINDTNLQTEILSTEKNNTIKAVN